jgi:hypothetical protein
MASGDEARRALVVVTLLLMGCGDGAAEPPPNPDPEPEPCATGTLSTDSGCLEPGVPPTACAEGFESADGGCRPIRPAMPCPEGELAFLGETSCHPPTPCGAEPWGDIPLEAGAQFVDQSFTGASDGSEAAPWTTIQAGIAAAAPGAQVRVAAGDYVEDVEISGKPVRLIGRCAAMVSVSDATGPVTTVGVFGGASGSEVRGLSITGSQRALGVSGSTDVSFAGLHLHDTSNTALLVQDAFGPTSASLTDSLIERPGGAAALIEGALLTMDRVEVRDAVPNANGPGRGPNVQDGGELVMTRSVVTTTVDTALYVSGSRAQMSGSLLSDNLGRGLNVQTSPATGLPSDVAVEASVVSSSLGLAVFTSGSSLSMADSVVTGAAAGEGVARGWAVFGQDAGPEAPAALTLERCLVEEFDAAGVNMTGGALSLSRCWIRGATGVDAAYGRGVNVQLDPTDQTPASGAIHDSWIADAFDVGLLFNGATGTVGNVAVQRVAPNPGAGEFGDGILVTATELGPVDVTLDAILVSESARAGLAVFSATVALTGSAFDCNPIHLNGEDSAFGDFALTDGGGNRCGCGELDEASCKVLSAGLEPPEALPAQ